MSGMMTRRGIRSMKGVMWTKSYTYIMSPLLPVDMPSDLLAIKCYTSCPSVIGLAKVSTLV